MSAENNSLRECAESKESHNSVTIRVRQPIGLGMTSSFQFDDSTLWGIVLMKLYILLDQKNVSFFFAPPQDGEKTKFVYVWDISTTEPLSTVIQMTNGGNIELYLSTPVPRPDSYQMSLEYRSFTTALDASARLLYPQSFMENPSGMDSIPDIPSTTASVFDSQSTAENPLLVTRTLSILQLISNQMRDYMKLENAIRDGDPVNFFEIGTAPEAKFAFRILDHGQVYAIPGLISLVQKAIEENNGTSKGVKLVNPYTGNPIEHPWSRQMIIYEECGGACTYEDFTQHESRVCRDSQERDEKESKIFEMIQNTIRFDSYSNQLVLLKFISEIC